MTELTQQTVRTYLKRRTDSEPTYLKAREIADEIGGTPKAVAQHLRRLQDELTEVSLEQWGRSKSVTWLVQRTDEGGRRPPTRTKTRR